MNKGNLIPADEFCASRNIEFSFITTLKKAGMIEVTTVKKTEYIHESHLPDLERIVNLYYDLDINLEGIEAINHLLQRINEMQDEITLLKNRLRLYESIEL